MFRVDLLNLHTDIRCENEFPREGHGKLNQFKAGNVISEEMNTSLEIVEFKLPIQQLMDKVYGPIMENG